MWKKLTEKTIIKKWLENNCRKKWLKKKWLKKTLEAKYLKQNVYNKNMKKQNAWNKKNKTKHNHIPGTEYIFVINNQYLTKKLPTFETKKLEKKLETKIIVYSPYILTKNPAKMSFSVVVQWYQTKHIYANYYVMFQRRYHIVSQKNETMMQD